MIKQRSVTKDEGLDLTVESDHVLKKKQDVFAKARNKLSTLSDALKPRQHVNGTEMQKKSKTQTTLDYFRRPRLRSAETEDVVYNSGASTSMENGDKKTSIVLQKQNSVGAYPIKIEERPSTVCVVDKIGDDLRQTAALALERPRKKLSFREPEIIGRSSVYGSGRETLPKSGTKTQYGVDIKRSVSVHNGHLHRGGSYDDLESQAMRVVRTVGQAFEVCHKLSINAPSPEPADPEDQDTQVTQDLLSDRLSDITSDKPKKDLSSEIASDIAAEEELSSDKGFGGSLFETRYNEQQRPFKLDILPPPPSANKRNTLTSGETYASPLTDALLTGGSGSGGSLSLPAAGSALSAHHEIQLLREQLEQQGQQTQAAIAQLQLTREQLAAEQSARLEAQARTHQLLVHNRELLDHIAALVAHLQEGDRSSGQSQASPHVTMPQQSQHPMGLVGDSYMGDRSEPGSLEQSPVMQAFAINAPNLIENRAATACLPPSPLRNTFNHNTPNAGGVFNFNNFPTVDPTFENQLLQRLQTLGGYNNPAANFQYAYPGYLMNNNYTLQPPPQKKLSHSPLAVRQSYGGSPIADRRISPAESQQHLRQSQQKLVQCQEESFIKPLSQIGTLTATDADGRVRVIVPVPSSAGDDVNNLLSALRLEEGFRSLNGPAITRSTSEKVPNRSELMSQVQRTAWARHTTK